MHIEAFREYCLAKKGVTESFPFDAHTLVFKVMNKMFAIAPLERIPPQVNLKAEPEKAQQQREEYDGRILPGYHMNKHHWNTVHIQQIPEPVLRGLIDDSYALIVASLPKKVQREWEALE